MNDVTSRGILMLVDADKTVTAQQRSALEHFLKKMDMPEKIKLITGKTARGLLGEAEGRLVSRPYLRSLVDQGRLHQIRLSPRKIRYDEMEVLGMINNV